MKASVCEIAWLYMREKTLRALAVFFFGSVLLTSNPGVLVQMCASRAFMTAFQSAIIMLGLWMTFLIGIILKRQLASYRASLLPGYRQAHALVFAFILGALVMTGLVWSSYLALLFHVGFDDHLAVVAAAIFVSVISIVLGYLSVAWLVFFSFIIFCLFSDPVYMAVGGALGFTPSNILTIVIAAIVLAVFFKRFWDVMEESWEYPYLFSWSEKFNSAGRNANWAAAARALVVLRKIFGFKKDILVKSSEVQKLADASRLIGDLLKSGVVFSSDAYNAGPSFIFTNVNELKGDMLTEATKRAREAADKFAQESGAKVGDIQNANQGIIEINPAVEIPNDRPERQIDKKVRVVTTITYFLSN